MLLDPEFSIPLSGHRAISQVERGGMQDSDVSPEARTPGPLSRSARTPQRMHVYFFIIAPCLLFIKNIIPEAENGGYAHG